MPAAPPAATGCPRATVGELRTAAVPSADGGRVTAARSLAACAETAAVGTALAAAEKSVTSRAIRATDARVAGPSSHCGTIAAAPARTAAVIAPGATLTGPESAASGSPA